VNCRLNEEKVFPSPKISGVLEEHYVEARLHNDGEHAEEIIALQQELGRSAATPLYLVLDPRSQRSLKGPLGGVTTVRAFREFLLGGVEAWERVGRLEQR